MLVAAVRSFSKPKHLPAGLENSRAPFLQNMRFLSLQRCCRVLLLIVAVGNLPGQRQVTIRGYPVEGINFEPLPAIFITVARGAVKEASLEITNRRPVPLKIGDIINPSQRFTTRVETLEQGKRFRLVVTLKGEGPAGKKQDVLELKTNLEDAPVLRIPVNTWVREKVRTFPDSVFMGRYPISEIRDNSTVARKRAQILMVYRDGTDQFQARVSSDIPFLKITSERGPKGDRYENTIWFDPELAQPGDIKGNIIIETNEPEVPKLVVPVTGQLQPK